MPRYYRRRATRVVKPKKKWASNLVNLSPTSDTTGGNSVVYKYVICQNANPTNVPTPVILKTGNFKLQCDAFFNLSANAAVSFSAYIMYVPEGTVLNGINDVTALIARHPEWIMAWKYSTFDYVSGAANIDTIRVSSRLKRNLNSGDSIMFLGVGITDTGVTYTNHGIKGMCQFWTCAN